MIQNVVLEFHKSSYYYQYKNERLPACNSTLHSIFPTTYSPMVLRGFCHGAVLWESASQHQITLESLPQHNEEDA
jgi:hypothetical protein